MEKMLYEKPSNLGDGRLNKRHKKIKAAAFKQPTKKIGNIFDEKSQKKATYRFFDNKKVTAEKLLEHSNEETIINIKNMPKKTVIIVPQDTTNVNYNGHDAKKDVLPTQPYIKHGVYIHSTIAVTSSRLTLGVLDAIISTGKTEEEKERIRKQKNRPIEEKASYRWILSFRKTVEAARQCPDKIFYNVSDREGDIYELLLEGANIDLGNVYYIIRSSIDRRTTTEDRKITKCLDNEDPIGKIFFEHEGRIVYQTVKVIEVKIKPPKNKSHLDEIKVWVVQAEEENPPEGQKPIKWILLTTSPVKSLEDAKKIIEYYTIRWEIEIFFFVLKNGCKIEEIGLQKFDRLAPALALYMSVASKIMFLARVGRNYPELPCDVVFSDYEWKIAYIALHEKKPPKIPLTLKQIITTIAILGGYTDRKTDPPPGPKVIWRGMEILHAMVRIFKALCKAGFLGSCGCQFRPAYEDSS